MKKSELIEVIDQAYDYAKKIVLLWNDYKMQQIRLETANLRKIEESRQVHIEEMDERKHLRYKLQKQANYERWKNKQDELNEENGKD